MFSVLQSYRDQPILVALSGGLDSSVLLHALSTLVSPDRLRAIHIHHGLSPNADAWQAHCEQLCADLHIDLITVRLSSSPQVGESIEAWAREQRYAAFAQQMREGEYLMCAQHGDDQAETVLLAMIRGSGPKGLSAMPLKKPFARGWLLRPFLGVSRQALEAYAGEHHLEWVHDESNDNTDYDRNFLRHEILPLLNKRWPSIEQNLVRVASHCAEQVDVCDALLTPLLVSAQGSKPGTLSIRALQAHPILIQKALIRAWLAAKAFTMPGHKKLDEIFCSVIPASEDGQPRVDWGDVTIRRYRDDLYALDVEQTLSLGAYRFEWTADQPLVLPHGAGTVTPALCPRPCTLLFDQRGLGLKDRFQEQGIPVWERARIPLMFVDDRYVGRVFL